MMGNKFWSELRATISNLGEKPMVKTASAKDQNRVAVADAKASGFFVRAKSVGWGLYQVEELDGGLGSIWHVEKDAATGEQFLVKQVDPVGDIVRRVKTAAVSSAPPRNPNLCFTCGVLLSSDVIERGGNTCADCVENVNRMSGGVKIAGDEGADTPCKECGKPLGMVYLLDDLGICTQCVKKRHRDVTDPGWRKRKASIVVAEGDLVPEEPGIQPATAPKKPGAMSDMVRSYLGTALWAETDNADDSGGEPLDKNYNVEDFAPEAVAKAVADCAAFEHKAGSLLDGIERRGEDVPDVIGFHFWLTRNGHGAGFWDGDYPKEIGDALTALSHEFGETDAYVGDDGKLYLS